MISILLIDDDAHEEELIRMACERTFESSFQLDFATCSSEAVGRLLENEYDLILLDNNLSKGLNANFTTPILKAFSGDAAIVIISNNICINYLKDPAFLGVGHILDKEELEPFLTQCKNEFHRPNLLY